MRTLGTVVVTLALLLAAPGCSRPQMPSLTGMNKFRDISQVKRGMSPNEVQRVLGSNYKTVYEEGIQGIDGGNFIWDYPEGRIFFGMDGVKRVAPSN